MIQLIVLLCLSMFYTAGYFYNYQTKEFYNLSYPQEPPEGPARFGGLLAHDFNSIFMQCYHSLDIQLCNGFLCFNLRNQFFDQQ